MHELRRLLDPSVGAGEHRPGDVQVSYAQTFDPPVVEVNAGIEGNVVDVVDEIDTEGPDSILQPPQPVHCRTVSVTVPQLPAGDYAVPWQTNDIGSSNRNLAIYHFSVAVPVHGGTHAIASQVNGLRGDMNAIRCGMNAKRGGMNAERGEINVERGEMNAECGEMNVERGEVNVERGDINVERGDINVERGDINVERGHMNAECGHMNVECGEINVKRGEINVERGEMNGVRDHF